MRNKIFIRECYQPLHDAILKYVKMDEQRGVVLLGTPGIGKSVFGVLEACRLVCEGRTVYYQFNADCVLQLSQNCVKLMDKFSFYKHSTHSDDWYIVDVKEDGMKPLDVFCDVSILLISSPKRENWYNFLKQNSSTTLYMPCWSLDELRLCREKVYLEVQEERLNALHSKFGGVARYVLKTANNPKHLDVLTSAIREVDAKECLRIQGEHSKRMSSINAPCSYFRFL